MSTIKTLKTITLALLAFCGANKIYSQPNWSVNPSGYTNSMVVAGAININKVESADTNDVVAAFVNGECRGVAKPFYQQSANRYIAYLIIYSNATSGTVNYRLYDASSGDTLNVGTTHNFTVNGLVGNAARPYVWASPTLNSVAGISAFTLPGQQGPTVISGQSVSMLLTYGTGLTQLAPTFTLSEGATAWVNSVKQVSGTTTQDFTNTVVYTIRSEDEQSFVNFSVTGTTIPNAAPIFPDTAFTVAENTGPGFLVGTMAAVDTNAGQTLTFRLATVSGMFSVSGTGGLYLLQSPDYETQSVYTLKVIVSDNGIPVASDTATVTVNIQNLIESQLGAVKAFTPNGDGINDFFYIPGVEIYTGYKLIVFNSLGNIVYEKDNYDNSWNGTYNGSSLPAGVYYYSFKGDKLFTGSLTLIR